MADYLPSWGRHRIDKKQTRLPTIPPPPPSLYRCRCREEAVDWRAFFSTNHILTMQYRNWEVGKSSGARILCTQAMHPHVWSQEITTHSMCRIELRAIDVGAYVLASGAPSRAPLHRDWHQCLSLVFVSWVLRATQVGRGGASALNISIGNTGQCDKIKVNAVLKGPIPIRLPPRLE